MEFPDVSTWTGWTFGASVGILALFSFFRGWAMAGPQVDKIVQGYKDTIEKQDELIDSLQEQNRQLLESQTTATQFYSELLAKPEAVERPGDAPPKGVTVG